MNFRNEDLSIRPNKFTSISFLGRSNMAPISSYRNRQVFSIYTLKNRVPLSRLYLVSNFIHKMLIDGSFITKISPITE